jgi:cobaltochelatase CobS
MEMQFNVIPMTAFGVQSNHKTHGFASDHEFMDLVPASNAGYVFRMELLQRFSQWLYDPCDDACMLVGPTGSGKSSLVEQVASRLNWPALTVSAHSRMEMPELTGYNLPYTDPVTGDLQTRFVDGPLTKALRHGFVFVLDEYDTLDPAVSVGLHAVLEGRPLVIAENGGEVVRPHPNFRFVACGNTAGQGDENSLYAATMQQNLATLDRFRVFEVSYLDKDVELLLLNTRCPDLENAQLTEMMVDIANSIRDRHQGNGADYLSVTMSTRTLLRWGRIACDYLEAELDSPLQMAMDEALLNRCDQVQRLAIEKIAQSKLGATWSTKTKAA